jgi:hypothetical protein
MWQNRKNKANEQVNKPLSLFTNHLVPPSMLVDNDWLRREGYQHAKCVSN